MTNSHGTRAPHSPRPPSGRFLAFTAVGFVLINAIGLIAYRVVKSRPQQAPPAASAAPPPAENSASLIRAYRAAGTQALEAGDYDLAIEKLSKAAKLGGGGDIRELLTIANEMQASARRAASVPPQELGKVPPAVPEAAPPTSAPEPADDPEPTRAANVGSLYVLSPSVYGEIYVDGVAHGFPPIEIDELPVGQAVVEVRVQGQPRRTKTVRVRAGERIEVSLR